MLILGLIVMVFVHSHNSTLLSLYVSSLQTVVFMFLNLPSSQKSAWHDSMTLYLVFYWLSSVATFLGDGVSPGETKGPCHTLPFFPRCIEGSWSPSVGKMRIIWVSSTLCRKISAKCCRQFFRCIFWIGVSWSIETSWKLLLIMDKPQDLEHIYSVGPPNVISCSTIPSFTMVISYNYHKP